MNQFERLLEIFKKQEGRRLSKVWTQASSIDRGPSEQDRPPVESDRRVVLDFKGEESRVPHSVYIRISDDQGAPTVLGFGEY